MQYKKSGFTMKTKWPHRSRIFISLVHKLFKTTNRYEKMFGPGACARGNVHVALRYLHEALKCNKRLLGADHIQVFFL